MVLGLHIPNISLSLSNSLSLPLSFSLYLPLFLSLSLSLYLYLSPLLLFKFLGHFHTRILMDILGVTPSPSTL